MFTMEGHVPFLNNYQIICFDQSWKNLPVPGKSLQTPLFNFASLNSFFSFQVSFELIGIEMVHVGEVFDGSRDDLVTFMEQNGYKFQAKAGHDEFFAKVAQ
jgi:hypothetical protein